jgi:hypothetical protein
VPPPPSSTLFSISRFFLSATVLYESSLHDIPMTNVPAIHFPFKVYLPYTFIRPVKGLLQRWSIGRHGNDAAARRLNKIAYIGGACMEDNHIWEDLELTATEEKKFVSMYRKERLR